MGSDLQANLRQRSRNNLQRHPIVDRSLAMVGLLSFRDRHTPGKTRIQGSRRSLLGWLSAGWETQPQQGSDGLDCDMNAKVSVTLRDDRTGGKHARAEKELESMPGPFPQSCPQVKILKKGSTTLSGLKGVFMRCSAREIPV